MSDHPPASPPPAGPPPGTAHRLVLEFPLDAGQPWLEKAREAAAPYVVRLGQIERPDRLVLICEVEEGAKEALIAALKEAWDSVQDSSS